MVRGLPLEFDVVGAYINQSSPSWETARSMLQLEQHRKNARQNQSHTALAVFDDRSQKNPTGAAHGNRNQTPSYQPYSDSRQQLGNSRGRGGYGRGRGRNPRG